MSDTVIKIENLGKKYRISHKQQKYLALRDILVDKAKRLGEKIFRPLEWLWAGGYTCAEKQNPYVEKRCRMSANREYKDSLFTALFSDAEKLLSLYNAVSGSDLPPDTSVEIATLEDVLFNCRRNDVAFVLGDKIVILMEHQSSISANMPLRLLIYVARVYEKLIDNEAVYKSKLLKIPKPDFIVLMKTLSDQHGSFFAGCLLMYNGADEFPDEKTLRLSDAYMEMPEVLTGFRGSLELEVRVVNINEGRNETIVNTSLLNEH